MTGARSRSSGLSLRRPGSVDAGGEAQQGVGRSLPSARLSCRGVDGARTAPQDEWRNQGCDTHEMAGHGVYPVVYPARHRNQPARAHAIQRDSRKLPGKCGYGRGSRGIAQACQARGRPTAVRLLERLLAASRDPPLYQLTDYHWLMIYWCLQMFCDLHNDEAATEPSRRTKVGPYFIGPH